MDEAEIAQCLVSRLDDTDSANGFPHRELTEHFGSNVSHVR